MANVILTNLSILSNMAKLFVYKSDIGEISGKQTNEAPIKYLISYLNKNAKSVGRILAVATKEAKESYDNICKVLKEYSEEKNIAIPEPEMIETTENTIAETIQEISNKISTDDEVYIDTTGGFRNSSYLIMGAVRVLEYSDIKVKKAVYSNHQKEKIEDITDLYRMFDLINAANTFTSVGNSYELEEYFKDTDNATVKSTIEAMNKFSDEITLCRTSKLNDVIKELNNCLEELSGVQSDSKDIILFKSLSEAIRSKFNIHGERISYPDVVEWCVHNRLIQQAVTIYVEKMPEYFYNKKLYTVSDSIKKQVENKKSTFDYYYEVFYNTMMKQTELPEEIQQLAEIIRKSKEASLLHCPKFIKKSEEEIIFDALAECNDTSTFMNRVVRLKKYNFTSSIPYLQKYFKVRNSIWREKTLNNKEEINKNLKNYPNVIEIINTSQKSLPNTPDKFPIFLVNDQKLLKAVFEIEKSADGRISFIETLAERGDSENYKFAKDVPTKEIQKMFRDILYFKIFVRNKLNHASEEDKISEEMLEYFTKCGYKTNEELNVRELSDILCKTIKTIKVLR